MKPKFNSLRRVGISALVSTLSLCSIGDDKRADPTKYGLGLAKLYEGIGEEIDHIRKEERVEEYVKVK